MNVMTFSTSREGAYSKLLKVLRVETVLISVFLEAAECAKQSINVYLKRIKKTGKGLVVPGSFLATTTNQAIVTTP